MNGPLKPGPDQIKHVEGYWHDNYTYGLQQTVIDGDRLLRFHCNECEGVGPLFTPADLPPDIEIPNLIPVQFK